MEIRALHEGDAAAWWRVRVESLESEPLAFGKSADEHRATPVEAIASRFRDAPETTLNLGAFVDGELVGTATFVRETGEKDRHKGHVYGVYVRSAYRKKGIGRALLLRLLELASEDSSLENILLAVTPQQEAAGQLYRSLGFVTFGIEPRALKVGSTYVDQHHMILQIERSTS